MTGRNGRLRILTWHVHGSYLYYLTRVPHDFYLPVKEGRPEGYGGRSPGFAWGDNVFDIDASDVKNQQFDVILFQSKKNYLEDQNEILSDVQRSLPRIYLEHDPPREVPTDTRHPIDDPEALLVHVTHFNELMWDAGGTPTRVIEHGVTVPDGVRYSGEEERGVVVVNGIRNRGRRLGFDVFERARRQVPLDLVGMASEEAGGIGEVPHDRLPAFVSRYRFFFNPIRYTSMGLAVCEAMMIGMPIVGLATTEMPRVIENGVSGFVSTSVDEVIEAMQELRSDAARARRLGEGARERARASFGIERFIRDWNETFALVTGQSSAARSFAAV